MWPGYLIVDPVDPRSILPPEEGALILVLGGSAVLALSLGVALVRGGSRLQHRGPPTPAVGPRPQRPPDTAEEPTPIPSRMDRHELMLKTAARAGVGTPQLVTTNPGPHGLLLVNCLGCRTAEGETPCSWKRASLEQALRQFDPHGRVVHVSCRPEPRACIFEIQTGDAGS